MNHKTQEFFFEKHEISNVLDGNDDAMLEKFDQVRATATISMTVLVEILRNSIN
jgi:hypothetical protein